MLWCNRLRDLVAEHKAAIVDLWGTVHDGQAIYPEAIAALEGLRDAGLDLVLLSNAPRPGTFETQRLVRMGMPTALTRDLLTAGDIWRGHVERSGPRAVVHCGPPGNRCVFDGLTLDITTLERADAIVVSDLDPGLGDIAGHEPWLLEARRRGLPMHCINPDRQAVVPGGIAPRGGAVGARYEAMGGVVTWYGKPAPVAFARALAMLGDPPPGRVLSIGDNLDTDIAGGAAAGLSTVLVTSGREVQRLGLAGDRASDGARLAPLLSAGCRLIETLRW